jgi:hypothetical protein
MADSFSHVRNVVIAKQHIKIYQNNLYFRVAIIWMDLYLCQLTVSP